MDLATSDEAHMAAAGRLLVGRFLTLAFLRPPGAPELEQLLPLLAELPMETQHPAVRRGVEKLAAYGRWVSEQSIAMDEAAHLLRRDYATLFEGPGPLVAPPWESVYRTEERTLFGPTTLQVRDAYRRWGLQPERSGSEPEDHIALELTFLTFLAEQAEGRTEAAAEREHFLKEHLLKWVGPFTEAMEQGAETLFYQGVAALLLGYLLTENA